MSAASELLAALERRGIRLRVEGERLAYEAPAGTLRDGDRKALLTHKAAVLGLLRERQARTVEGVDWSRVSLHQLDRVLEIGVPWADVPLILAPGCRIAHSLRAQDPQPGRVWCTCEVLDLLMTGVTCEDARRVADARLTLDGPAVRIRRRPGHRLLSTEHQG